MCEAAGGAPGLVGRDPELAVLSGAVRRLATGGGAVVLVEGAAGTGKSGLLAELRRIAVASGIDVAHTVAIDLDRDLPFAVIERVLGVQARDGEESGGATAVGLSERGLSRLRWVVDAVRQAPVTHPRLVVIDDLHWADELSLRAIELLLAEGPAPGLGIALAWRRAELSGPVAERLRAVDGAVGLTLSDLDPASSAELVRRLLSEPHPEFLAASHRITGGNPLLVHELAGAVAASGRAADHAGAEWLAEVTASAVRSATLARLAGLSDAAVELACAVAVLGDGSPLHHAATVAQLDRSTAAAAADRLVAIEILSGERLLSFRHPVLGAAVLGDIAPFTRAELYRRAAAVVAADGGFERAGALLLRCPPGGDPEAVRCLQAAARSAMQRGDALTGVRLLRRAVDEPARPDEQAELLIDLARAEVAAGEPQAVARLDDALRLIDDPERRARTLRGLARLHHARYDFPRAARLAERALAELAPDDRYRDRLGGTWLAAAALDPERLAQTGKRFGELVAAAHAESLPDDPELQAVASLFLVTIGDDPQLAAAIAERAIERDAVVNDDGLGVVPDYALHALLAGGRLASLMRCADTAIQTAEHHASTLGVASAACWRAHARLATGDLQRAVADAETALIPRRLGWPMHSTYAAAALALARLELGDPTGASEAIAMIAEVPIPDPPNSYFTGLVELGCGRPGPARSLFERAAEDLARWGVDTPAILPWRSGLALAALAVQDQAAARELTATEVELARRTAVPAVIGRSLRVHGLALGGPEGIDVLHEACAILERSEHVLEHLRAQVDLGSALRREGDRSAAREQLKLAGARATALGCVALAERAASEHAASGGRQRREPADGVGSLTASELRIARLAASGRTNPQIAAELFLTRKTVEWHLSHIFRKLDITARSALSAALALPPETGDGA